MQMQMQMQAFSTHKSNPASPIPGDHSHTPGGGGQAGSAPAAGGRATAAATAARGLYLSKVIFKWFYRFYAWTVIKNKG